MSNLDIKLQSEYFTSIDNNILSLGQALILLRREHNEQVATEVIRKYCMETNVEEIQRVGMEFLYINGYYADLQNLVIKNKGSLNPLNQNWADVFQILIDRRYKRRQAHIYHQRLNNVKTDDPQLICLIELSKVALYYDQNEFGKIGNFLEIQPNLFNQIEDDFLLSSYNLKLYQHLFVYYWVRNELIMARKYAFRALNKTNSALTKSSLNINLGLTYTFDTFQQGMYHTNEALKISRKHGLNKIHESIKQYNIPFLAAHFKQVDGISSTDKSEQAHIEIAKGNRDKAIAILNEVPIDSPFKLYYLGLAKQDENILQQSYTDFIEKRSDYFFSRLPFNALKKLRQSSN